MKVLVAVSGGLKSLVTAWLLKKQGMQVRGVYFDLIGQDKSQEKIEALERKLGISIQMVPAQADFANALATANELAIAANETIDPDLYFHQSFLFPKLMELKAQHGFDKVSTGHRALIQEDQVSKVFRVYQNADGDLKETLYLIGRDQKDLSALLLPLGSIPSSMFGKLSKELDVSTWSNRFVSPTPDLIRFDVFNAKGVRLGVYEANQMPLPGGVYASPEKGHGQYRIVDILPNQSQMVVSEEGDLECQEVHFQDASWFSRADLGLKTLNCHLVSPGNTKTLPVRLLQYEGGRVKGFLNHALSGQEANIFKGQTVLWVEGTEILGGGRILGTR